MKSARVLVVGDVMMDVYINGEASRLSPEAPVPVLRPLSRWTVPGGAANVAMNLAAIGCKVGLLCVIGEDSRSLDLVETLRDEEVDVISTSVVRPIATKTRIRTDLQHIVRIDEEDDTPLEVDDFLCASLRAVLRKGLFNVVILSDYNKGLFTKQTFNSLTAICAEFAVPVLSDPKRADRDLYQGVALLKPNLHEAKSLSGYTGAVDTATDLVDLATRTLSVTGLPAVVVTGASLGSVLVEQGKTPVHCIPPRGIPIVDVSGAGDAFLSYLAAGVATGLDLVMSTQIATVAATVSCTRVGTTHVRLDDLIRFHLEVSTTSDSKVVPRELLREIAAALPRPIVFTNGCFDVLHPGHVASLEFAREQGQSLVVACNSDESVRRLKGDSRPLQSFDVRARVLAGLAATTLVCEMTEDDPLELIQMVRPDVLVKGNDYENREVVGGAFVESTGGRVVLSPLLHNYSTTKFAQQLGIG